MEAPIRPWENQSGPADKAPGDTDSQHLPADTLIPACLSTSTIMFPIDVDVFALA
jgi:hypothetical protein